MNTSVHPSKVTITKIVTNPAKVSSKLIAPEFGFKYPFAQIYLTPYESSSSQSVSNEHIIVESCVEYIKP